MKALPLMLGAIAVLLLAGGAAGAAKNADRRQPTPGPTPPVATPKIERATLTNGLAVWVVQRHELPVVNAVQTITTVTF